MNNPQIILGALDRNLERATRVILTKMMREDPQDRDDIAFLLRRESITPAALRDAFAAARVPAIDEIRSAFAANQARVLALASEIGR